MLLFRKEMLLSKKLKESNIVAYLLYMWQIEDIMRAYNCNVDKLRDAYLAHLNLGEERAQVEAWYADLADMMRQEGVEKEGHLQINKNIIIQLTDLHLQLLKSPKYPYYSAAYYKALPFIVELRSKGEKNDLSEIENCFDLLYGVSLLRMQKKEISESTLKAASDITLFLNQLADFYKKDKAGELDLE